MVNITTTQYARVSYFSYDVTEVPAGSGAGFLWGDDGHIVTNYHVIRGADKLTVAFGDGSTFSAKKIGQEPKKDIAVLKIDDLGSWRVKIIWTFLQNDSGSISELSETDSGQSFN